MTLNEIFKPSPETKQIIADKFPGATLSMSFLMEIPVDLATTIYQHGAEQAGLNKTSSLYAVFNAGVHEFIKALESGEAPNDSTGKREKPKTKRRTKT